MTILLFDVDGTLTKPMCKIDDDMIEILHKLKEQNYILAVVGGSDYGKISSQLSGALDLFTYIFTENGLVSYKDDVMIEFKSIKSYLNDVNYQKLINKILYELSQIILPTKCDRFIEVRNACINISPIGRSCNYQERIEFYEYDNIYYIRKNLIEKLSPLLDELGLTAVVGGMISIDIYPDGWDKTYCLKFLDLNDKIYFYGDNTKKGGNDHSIYNDNRVIGTTISGPLMLINILSNFL